MKDEISSISIDRHNQIINKITNRFTLKVVELVEDKYKYRWGDINPWEKEQRRDIKMVLDELYKEIRDIAIIK